MQMASAQEEAKAVAMRAVGKQVTQTISIAGVRAGGPADGKLRTGDEIVSLGGTPIASVTDLRDKIQAAPAGGSLALVCLLYTSRCV